MKTLTCIVLGYLLGSLNPAALLGKLKRKNLRETGTGNLGASNTMLVLGKKYGAFVMIFDILKAWTSSKVARLLFPQMAIAGLLAGLGAVLGHIFPFYLHFAGGKGLAAFGGMALAYDPVVFLALLTLGLLLMLLVNASYVMPMSVAPLFVMIVALQTRSLSATLVAAAAAVLIIVKHWSNIGKAKQGHEIDIRGLLKKTFSRKT